MFYYINDIMFEMVLRWIVLVSCIKMCNFQQLKFAWLYIIIVVAGAEIIKQRYPLINY